jgi:hypothetical protein
LVPGLLILKAEVVAELVRLPSTPYSRLALEEVVAALVIVAELQAAATPVGAQVVQAVILAAAALVGIQVTVVMEVLVVLLQALVLEVGQAAAVLTLAGVLVS